MHLTIRGQWNYVRKLEAVEYFLCKGYKNSSNDSRFSLPFSAAGTGSTALTRNSVTTPDEFSYQSTYRHHPSHLQALGGR